MERNLALICEFNPLHKGHQAILSRAAKLGGTVIAVMSGNFTQRSVPAVFDKYKRAEAALRCGADAVLELPFPWCSAGAEFFAFGGVSVAAGVGLTDFIFGSETGDTSHVLHAAEILDSMGMSAIVNSSEPSEGAAVTYDRVLREFGISLGSNDKLAAEYVRAAKRLGLDARFTAYPRMTDPDLYRSATCLREMLSNGDNVSDFIPDEAWQVFRCATVADVRRLDGFLFNHFRLIGAPQTEVFDAGGGVAERLHRAAGDARCAEDFFRLAATKKYTDSRLRRAALYSLLGVTRSDLSRTPAFTVLLGANAAGREYLASVKKTRGIEVLTKPSDVSRLSGDALSQYELWRRADELYSLCLIDGAKRGEFLRRSPVIL